MCGPGTGVRPAGSVTCCSAAGPASASRGLEVDVAVADIGERAAQLRADTDATYRAKYGRCGSSSVDAMVIAETAAAPLQISPERGRDGGWPRR
jgi:hypothetical protein